MDQTKREIQSIGSPRDLTKITCIAHLSSNDDGISHDQSGQPPINPCKASLPSLVLYCISAAMNQPGRRPQTRSLLLLAKLRCTGLTIRLVYR
jgi:hypothetical protein